MTGKYEEINGDCGKPGCQSPYSYSPSLLIPSIPTPERRTAMHERKTIMHYSPDLDALTRKKRVCAYARVSSDRDEAFHSLSAQISYYQKKIAEHPDWEYAGVYSDRGITGTKENRPGFQAMLTACREKKVDIVLAKSITRFARNTVILLETVRELRSLGIDIHFEEEHIETLSEKGEFMISILAARAQEESRSASENQLWRIRKSYEKGIPVTGNCLGYRMVDHQFLIDEDEEQIVLRIFAMYLSGMGKIAIAKKLNKDGIKNRLGQKWSPAGIMQVITNEKYVGDLQLQKWYTVDHLTKKVVKNKGEKRSYLIKDDHDPIIDRQIFEKAQQEIAKRADKFQMRSEKKHYPFSGLIACGMCGSYYRRKNVMIGTNYRRIVWICNSFNTEGKEACRSQQIPEDILTAKTCEVLGISELDETVLHERIKKIIVPSKNTLLYVFNDGTEKRVEWQHRSRRESWTPEMREKARQQTKARYEAEHRKKEDKNGS